MRVRDKARPTKPAWRHRSPKTVVRLLFPQQSGVLPVLHCTLRNLYVLLAEDGLLGDDEMSQLSGKTLDLRNSAALLKMARMSVDATALEDSEYPYHCNPMSIQTMICVASAATLATHNSVSRFAP